MKQTNDDSNLDERLSDFTDRVLAGEAEHTESNADEKLQGFEETILRLKRVIPQVKLDDSKVKQWETQLAKRLRKEPTSLSFWQKWFGVNWKYGQFRPQSVLVVGMMILIGIAVLIVLNFPLKGSSVTAAAFVRNRPVFTAAALLALMLILVQISRRK